MTPPLDDPALQARKLLKRYPAGKGDHDSEPRELLERYHLGWDVQELFKAYGQYHRGVEPPHALGRRLRTSALMRTCTDTISSLAVAMQENPTPKCMAECSEIIACCTEMLNIANESSQDKVLPFMKLPLELRQMVYQYYFKNLHRGHPWRQPRIVLKTPVGCDCAIHNLKGYKERDFIPLKMPLIYTCSHIKDEALKVWFEDGLFIFACSCELSHCLQINDIMKYHLRNAKVHWRGEQSDSAFKLLQEASRLKSLVVVISRSTTSIISSKETLLRKYWPSRRQTKIPEALGFEELVELAKLAREHGLESLSVEHVEREVSIRRSDQDWYGLHRLLLALAGVKEHLEVDARLVKRRAPDYGADSDGDS